MDPDAAKWISLVLKRADELRKAGVTSIGPGSATFAPYGELPNEPPVDTSASAAPQTDERDPDLFNDPASYPFGVVPGYSIEKLSQE